MTALTVSPSHLAAPNSGDGATTLLRRPAGDGERAQALMAAIEAIYRERFPAFHRVATAITGDVEVGRDAVQEAFARAIRRRADFRGDGTMEGWLWRTVINVAKDQRRSTKGAIPMADMTDLLGASAGAPPDHDVAAIRERVSALPDRQRMALFLRYYVDMPYAEIGAVLEIRTGTVSAMLNAAHTTLRTRLCDVVDDQPAPAPVEGPDRSRAAAGRRRRRPVLHVAMCEARGFPAVRPS